MPYRINADLPPALQRHLPSHAQNIYRDAFNHAFASHCGDPRQEEAAHRIAWAAVKRSYMKVGDSWIRKAAEGVYSRGI
ncbi:MAG TPA: ChaB family protein [Xanthobacteraceae bacterium]|jgi:cation transport regulator